MSRYAEVSALLHDERLGHRFSDQFRRPFAAEGGAANALLQGIVSSLDPPEHTRVRRLLAKAIDRKSIRDLCTRLRPEVDRLLDRALAADRIDAVADLALPLQISAGCELLGLPSSVRHEVWPRAMSLGRAFIPFVPADGRNPADDDAVRWLRQMVADLLDERRRRPGHDVISRLLQVEHQVECLTDEERIDNAIFLFFAGFETSMYIASLAAALFARHPAQYDRVRADGTLVPTAVEELLRFDAPIQWMARLALAPLSIGDVVVRPGRVVLLLLGSANRDENQFTAPDEFDVGRSPNSHVSFGGGPHHCLGLHLARTQGAMLLGRLAARCAALEPAGPPLRRVHPNLRGYTSVPVRLVPA
jgi:cytochrome P450